MDEFQRMAWQQIEAGKGPFWRGDMTGSIPCAEVKEIGTALDVQVGGSHYKSMAIQPAEYCHRNGIGFLAGSAIKYLSRYQSKGKPIEDLRKARHFIDLLIEMELENAG